MLCGSQEGNYILKGYVNMPTGVTFLLKSASEYSIWQIS
jgi:hypothetical protein